MDRILTADYVRNLAASPLDGFSIFFLSRARKPFGLSPLLSAPLFVFKSGSFVLRSFESAGTGSERHSMAALTAANSMVYGCDLVDSAHHLIGLPLCLLFVALSGRYKSVSGGGGAQRRPWGFPNLTSAQEDEWNKINFSDKSYTEIV